MILNKIKLLFILQLKKLLEEVRKVTLNEKGRIFIEERTVRV